MCHSWRGTGGVQLMRKSRTVVGTAPLRTDTKTTTQLRGFFYVSLPARSYKRSSRRERSSMWRRLLRESADGAAIGRAVLALVLVPQPVYVCGRHRCPALPGPARIVGGGRVDRAGHFAMKGPIQARGGLGTQRNDSRRLLPIC